MVTRNRSTHFKNMDPWPSFTPDVISPAEAAQREQWATDTRNLIATRYADNPTVRDELTSMLFDPPQDLGDGYGRIDYRRTA